MFTSLKSFVNSRLGQGAVIDEHPDDNGYFITVDQKHIYSVLFFLKNDPDLSLNFLHQIVAVPSHVIFGLKSEKKRSNVAILYQLKSLKLPYRVTVVLEVETGTIPTVSPLFISARWQEDDIAQTYDVVIEKSVRD